MGETERARVSSCATIHEKGGLANGENTGAFNTHLPC